VRAVAPLIGPPCRPEEEEAACWTKRRRRLGGWAGQAAPVSAGEDGGAGPLHCGPWSTHGPLILLDLHVSAPTSYFADFWWAEMCTDRPQTSAAYCTAHSVHYKEKNHKIFENFFVKYFCLNIYKFFR
jgi:hypothetical protein